MPKIKCSQTVIECAGIIFDKDGTLIDSFQVWPRLLAGRVLALQRELSFDDTLAGQIARALGMRGASLAPNSPMVFATREQTAAIFAAMLFLHLDVPWTEGLARVQRAFEETDKELGPRELGIPVPGAVETLAALAAAGVKMAVATNDNAGRTRDVLAAAGLLPYISACACADEVKSSKPSPDMVNLACQRLGLDPSQCLVVGDSVLDIKMGQSAGALKTIGVLTGGSDAQELKPLADIILPDVTCIKIA